MSLTARHKKPGGFRKLVNSLEITPPDRRKKILDSLKNEDPDFGAEAEKYIFNFEEFKNVPDMVLADVMHGMKNEMKSVAIALFKSADEAMVEKFKKNMAAPQVFAFREETQNLTIITASEQMAARFRIIQKARDLQQSGLIVLKKYSPKFSDM